MLAPARKQGAFACPGEVTGWLRHPPGPGSSGLVNNKPSAARDSWYRFAVILARVNAFVAAGAGFLLAVLWFDLMFDVQALRHREGDLPEPVLASVSTYYARVTTAARPMNRLIAAVMLGIIAAIIAQIAEGDAPTWVGWTSLALAGGAIALAAARTVPNAVCLGTRADPPADQSRLARSILRDHLLCLAAIAAVLTIQLATA